MNWLRKLLRLHTHTWVNVQNVMTAHGVMHAQRCDCGRLRFRRGFMR